MGRRSETERQPLRAELEALLVVEETEHAIGWNHALREAIKAVDRHELKRQQHSARAISKRKSAGKRIGGDLPYGYEVGPDGETLRECPYEQRVIATARKLREAGHSLRDIANRLTQRDFEPREGKTFHAAQISRMLDEKSA